ncbi:UTP--glucose-1-phosphate uridylyltransferase, partial [Kocuria sp. CCUG 69068]
MSGNSNPRTVRKAVIPAAGLGTRFLPATKAMPKEMLPVVD